MKDAAEGSIGHPSQEQGLLKSKGKLKNQSAFVVPSQAISVSWSHRSNIIWDLFQSRH